ncbi:pilus assembly PilX family protein [Comamonas suwonensis]|uniref:Type IV pilus assembly protein PilX n=1 Tax=Comamonas suwonensis TaxID=2606214 RepID=A0A843BES8_9BURK|nr:PilX N-terminal domain-containing pilus assembly protein [Comamonas suwonensis]MBI1625478.1 hypothetical protein [Comamonas suwonensis]
MSLLFNQIHLKKNNYQRGVSLIVVLLILVIVSILGVSGVQISMMAEKSSRNDRDYQIAWQASEAALVDAEFDIEGLPAGATNKRNSIFKLGQTDISKFITGCGASSPSTGLCSLNETGKPAWLAVDFTNSGNNANTIAFGTFTGRTFPAGGAGIQPSKPPRYVIEAIPDPENSRTTKPTDIKYIYRVTAMGFGPNPETQTVVQMLYRN